MGFFRDVKKLWHDIRSTRKIKDFGVVCETSAQGRNAEYSADLREISGERYLYLHRTLFRGTGPAIKILDLTKDELKALTKDFEHITNKTYVANESDLDILAEIKEEMGGSRFAAFMAGAAGRSKTTIKNFDRIARQNTGEKRIETCLVLVKEKSENLIYLVRREREKRSMQYDQFIFREADAILVAKLFKDAVESL